mgnify:CR=1 FL=1
MKSIFKILAFAMLGIVQVMFPDAFVVYHPAARLRSSVRGIRLAALVATPFFPG